MSAYTEIRALLEGRWSRSCVEASRGRGVSEHQSLSPEALGRWCPKTPPDSLTLPPKPEVPEPSWLLWLSQIPTPLLHPQSSSMHILSVPGRDKEGEPSSWLLTPHPYSSLVPMPLTANSDQPSPRPPTTVLPCAASLQFPFLNVLLSLLQASTCPHPWLAAKSVCSHHMKALVLILVRILETHSDESSSPEGMEDVL